MSIEQECVGVQALAVDTDDVVEQPAGPARSISTRRHPITTTKNFLVSCWRAGSSRLRSSGFWEFRHPVNLVATQSAASQ
jgi:hypothetical protein